MYNHKPGKLFWVVLSLLMFVIILCSSIKVYAQQAQPVQTEYVFRLTVPEVDVIGKALGTQPYNDVVGLINKLRQQYVEQQPKPEPKKE